MSIYTNLSYSPLSYSLPGIFIPPEKSKLIGPPSNETNLKNLGYPYWGYIYRKSL